MKKIRTFLLFLLCSQIYFSQVDSVAIKKDSIPKIVKTWDYINVQDTIKYPFLKKTEETIKTLLNDPVLKKAHWGFCLYNPKTNEVLVNKGIKERYLPASTTKILSAESALHYLGANYRWKTQVLYTGEIDSLGVLQGDLHVVYNGDPTIGLDAINAKGYSEIVNEVFFALKQKGIKSVKGNIIAESVVFKKDAKFYNVNKYFLNFGDYYSVIPSKDGKLVAVKEIKKTISATEKEDLESINEELDPEEQIINDIIADLENSIRAFKFDNIELKNSMLPNPPSFLANKIKEGISRKGIKIFGKLQTQDYKNMQITNKRKLLFNYDSPTLDDLAFFTVQRSNNTYADHLLRATGYLIGKEDTQINSIRTVENYLKETDFDFDGFVLADGSGLSRSNWITPISQVKFLTYVLKQPYFNTFYKWLPSAGESGTLRGSFLNSPLKGNIHAKTGTLNAVKTLAGYVDLPNGERLTFSLMINSYSGGVAAVKSRMEKLLETVLY